MHTSFAILASLTIAIGACSTPDGQAVTSHDTSTPSRTPATNEGAPSGQAATTPCNTVPDDKPGPNQGGSAPDAGSGSLIDVQARFDELAAATTQVSYDALFELFDSLSPNEPAFMIGEWEGGVFLTGHPGEQQLKLVNWVGKRFNNEDDVNPIISRALNGTRKVNPVLGTARLRSVRYRGVSTATMLYDQHPILDHFRKVSDDLVVGAMDKKGDSVPLFFYLRRLPTAAP